MYRQAQSKPANKGDKNGVSDIIAFCSHCMMLHIFWKFYQYCCICLETSHLFFWVFRFHSVICIQASAWWLSLWAYIMWLSQSAPYSVGGRSRSLCYTRNRTARGEQVFVFCCQTPRPSTQNNILFSQVFYYCLSENISHSSNPTSPLALISCSAAPWGQVSELDWLTLTYYRFESIPEAHIGDKYLIVHAAGRWPGERAAVVSPVFERGQRRISFSYLMRGQSVWWERKRAQLYFHVMNKAEPEFI